MTNLDVEIMRAKAQGARVRDRFTGNIPAYPITFQEGDVFTIPSSFTVYSELTGNTCNQFIFVETQNGTVIRLYPSQFSRKVRVCDENGNPTSHIVSADGTASQLYLMYCTVQEGMDSLRGKTIKVSAVTKVRTLYSVVKTVYTFDLV